MQFKDLQISLQKDPRGGPPIPMSELIPEGTKKFLGLTKLYRERYFRLPRSRFPGYPQIHTDRADVQVGHVHPASHLWGDPWVERNAHQFRYGRGKVINESARPAPSDPATGKRGEKHAKTIKRSLRHQIRVNFDEEQAFLDIEAQLSGTVVKEESEDENPVALPAPDPVAEDAPADTTSDPEFTGDLKRMGDGCGLRFNLPSLKCTDSGTGAIPELNYDTEADKCWMSYDGHLDPIDPIHHVCSSATVEFDSQGYTKLTNKQGETVIFQFSDRKVLQDRVEFALQTVKSKNPDSSFPS
ncbi:hypothetical protein N7492_004243 [Penicillium capsulatum]|uniref:Uncharacterized protein n=1 Tax=Penicillium capsulatum TaxID=69766 RepID=A0A9W9IA49_9EURO|nr:hypothetical protein N7492_004243 [Penicillium capsulatum]